MECARIITERTSDCGLTVSGGEPMLQAAGLLQMWHSVKKMRNDWTLLLFSGYYHSQLLKENHPDKVALVQAADAFVGGPYVAALNDGRGIRGSTNKEIWVPEGSRFSPEDVCFMAAGLRDVEYRERAYGTLAIGVPKPNAYQMDKGS
jgi:anaerobic ribonucleoside-triphosphate reductase activating protein